LGRTSQSGWSARAIATSIERSVHDGRVKAAEALPPVRELARKLKVSPATVAAAYRLLRTRGLTAAQGRRGTRVISRPPIRARGDARPSPDGAIDLSSGNPDPALLPPVAQALRSLDASPALYDASPLLPSLASFLRAELEADGVPASALTLAGGGLDAIERVLIEHLRPGDHVAIEDPCFPAVHDLLVACGYVPVPFAVDDEGPDPDSLGAALRQTCRALIVTTRAQNPTGAALTEARAETLRRLLRRHPELLLIESDPCGPVAGAPLVTLLDASRNRWAHVKSVAGFLGPDLRLAVLAGDSLTIGRVEGRFSLGPRRVSYLLQRLVLAIWSDPSAGRHLARASEVYRLRRTALLAALSARDIIAHGASGLDVWVPLRYEGPVVQGLVERGWRVAAGEPFRARTAPGIRITVATLLPEAAARLAATIAEVLQPAPGPSA
jgi:DNA-binding transcriptional MocR family regulator